jgi:hypothetical protein
MPLIRVYSLNLATGAAALVGSQTDTSANVAAYETWHTISLSFAAQTFTATTRLYAYVMGETGANSIPNAFTIIGISAAYEAV